MKRALLLLLVLAGLHGCAGFGPPADPANRVAPDQRFENIARLVSASPIDVASAFVGELAQYNGDPDYACRHPVYASYFARRFNHSTDYSACAASVPFLLMDQRRGARQVQVNPRDVRSVHVLFASSGEGVASRFGHVSVRLIVCPSAASTDRECAENVLNHVVLGFVARINEPEMDLVKGVLGGYDAHLMGMTFMETFRTNTLVADRNLYSVPLKLSGDQVEQMVRELSEVHWSFKGDYRFFTENCATLLQDTLLELFPTDSDRSTPSGFIRPDSFFTALQESAVVDASKLESLDEAERQGYYFSSSRPYYERAFNAVKVASGWGDIQTLEDYFSSTGRERLLRIGNDESLKSVYRKDQRSRQAHILIEDLAAMKLEYLGLQTIMTALARADVRDTLVKRLDELDDTGSRQWALECLVRPLQQLSSERVVFDGIPDGDVSLVDEGCSDGQQGRQLGSSLARIFDFAPAIAGQLLAIFSEREQVRRNVQYLKEL